MNSHEIKSVFVRKLDMEQVPKTLNVLDDGIV